MKTYFNTFCKRVAQTYLLSQVNIPRNNNYYITGFAGDNPEEYKNILQKFFNPNAITLCDKDKYFPGVIHTDVLNLPTTNIMDLDFECSFKKGGDIAIEILRRMRVNFILKRPIPINCYLMITFSLRGTTLKETLEWLDENIYDGTLSYLETSGLLNGIDPRSYVKLVNHTQKVFEESYMVQYRDTSNMLSLIIRFWLKNLEN